MRKELIFGIVLLLFICGCSNSTKEQLSKPLVGPESRINDLETEYNVGNNAELIIPLKITYSVPEEEKLRFKIKVESSNELVGLIYDQNEYLLNAKESVEIQPLKIISKETDGRVVINIKLIDLDEVNEKIIDSSSFFVKIE